MSEKTSPDKLKELYFKEVKSALRKQILDHKNVDFDLLLDALGDQSKDVASFAYKKIWINSHKLTEDILARLASDPSPFAKELAANNEKTPTKNLISLLNHSSDSILRPSFEILLRRQEETLDFSDELLSSPNHYHRAVLAANKKASIEILTKLLDDSSKLVSQTALKNIEGRAGELEHSLADSGGARPLSLVLLSIKKGAIKPEKLVLILGGLATGADAEEASDEILKDLAPSELDKKSDPSVKGPMKRGRKKKKHFMSLLLGQKLEGAEREAAQKQIEEAAFEYLSENDEFIITNANTYKKHPSEAIRKIVARSKNTPSHILLELMNKADQSMGVAEEAGKNYLKRKEVPNEGFIRVIIKKGSFGLDKNQAPEQEGGDHEDAADQEKQIMKASSIVLDVLAAHPLTPPDALALILLRSDIEKDSITRCVKNLARQHKINQSVISKIEGGGFNQDEARQLLASLATGMYYLKIPERLYLATHPDTPREALKKILMQGDGLDSEAAGLSLYLYHHEDIYSSLSEVLKNISAALDKNDAKDMDTHGLMNMRLAQLKAEALRLLEG